MTTEGETAWEKAGESGHALRASRTPTAAGRWSSEGGGVPGRSQREQVLLGPGTGTVASPSSPHFRSSSQVDGCLLGEHCFPLREPSFQYLFLS